MNRRQAPHRPAALPGLALVLLLVASCGDSGTTDGPPDAGPMADLTAALDFFPAPSDLLPGDLPAADLAPLPDLIPEPDLIPAADLASPPCDDTPGSCGMPGLCIDCSASKSGTTCVNLACGCNLAADCPPGTACDPGTHLCGAACASRAGDGGVVLFACNGGCCDGNSCVAGVAGKACGAGGGACAACGAGTPTCASGACTPTCAPDGKGGAACGDGFCCGDLNTCVAVAGASCGAPGAACVDCADTNTGPVCTAKGACGCNQSSDCPMGQACRDGACGTACDANATCVGGCCSIPDGKLAGTCVAGDQPDVCAADAVCSSCAVNQKGRACLRVFDSTTCGCNSAADCAAGQACSGVTHTCSAACDENNPCNGGCCTAAVNGTCVAGTQQGTCGSNGGVCASCAAQLMAQKSGGVCEPVVGGGQCGCGNNADCPQNSTGCNVNTKLCNFVCSQNNPCLLGCCVVPMGQQSGLCAPGTQPTLCGTAGVNGGLCVDCSGAVAGRLCLPGTSKCGCSVAGDCQAGQACNTSKHVCESMCGDVNHSLCNGGCCGGGKCVAGTAGNACGSGGGACGTCGANNAGHACIDGTTCGCKVAADCPARNACNTLTHTCEPACGDQAHSGCNGGCCQVLNGMQAGTCVAGSQNGACGNDGKLCGQCANGTPTCTSFTCAADCNKVGNGACDGGYCCNPATSKCVAGSAPSTCGFSGVCTNCSGNPNGSACETKKNPQGPWTCGCEAAGDCSAANPKTGTGGTACDLQANTCTTTCGINGLTTMCNGGCCMFSNGTGLCRAGTGSASCGTAGGLCNNCSANCGLQPTCTTGACGCCAGTNAVCNAAGQCCSGTCTKQKCVCVASGQTCSGNSALCCAGMVCGGANKCCLPPSAGCANNAQCCSASCIAGHCR